MCSPAYEVRARELTTLRSSGHSYVFTPRTATRIAYRSSGVERSDATTAGPSLELGTSVTFQGPPQRHFSAVLSCGESSDENTPRSSFFGSLILVRCRVFSQHSAAILLLPPGRGVVNVYSGTKTHLTAQSDVLHRTLPRTLPCHHTGI